MPILFCPDCGSSDIEHIDLGDETDVNGTYGNHRLRCRYCGRVTLDMDTYEDAVDAFLGNDEDNVTRGVRYNGR